MDREILKHLYQKYHRELYLYIYGLCRNRELTEDILQETFLKALLALSDEHTNIRAWLYMVARNLFLGDVRKQRGRVDIDELGEFSADDGDLSRGLVMSERRRLLYEALDSLGGIKKEVLMLQYFGGLPQKEIAAVLRLTPENVRVLSYRGRKELKQYLEANGYDI